MESFKAEFIRIKKLNLDPTTFHSEEYGRIQKLNLDPTIFHSEEYGRQNISEEISTKTNSQGFNPEWQNLFFVQFDGMPKCLICCRTLTLSTKFNLQRHYFKIHHDQYGMLNDEQRIGEIKNLKEKFFKLNQTTTPTSQNGSHECNVKLDNIKEEPQECETKCFVNTCSPIDIDMKKEVQCGPDCVKSEMQTPTSQNGSHECNVKLDNIKEEPQECETKCFVNTCSPIDIDMKKEVQCGPDCVKSEMQNEKYKCESCNVTYLNEDELASHMEFHVESLHVCEICHKKFPLKWSLLRHMLRHSKQTKKSFEHENCNQEFENASELRSHSVSYNALRPHVCDICNKRFSLRREEEEEEAMNDSTGSATSLYPSDHIPPHTLGHIKKIEDVAFRKEYILTIVVCMFVKETQWRQSMDNLDN
ncbi:hypothetical protein C0J52_22860 [Blattella germanica]|nr:hypothetical protein C0J52_22860 [Blattella germanica]